ncbi:MAG: hypothetical protein K2X99_07420 [Gemmatimonadaceae bacterium]|nr:hypothetical protein [Gemmatimonadaceae bacterium]
MTRTLRIALVAAALLPTLATAQGAAGLAGPACTLDYTNPPLGELARQRLASAQGAKTGDERAKFLRDAMKFINDKKFDVNPGARAYLTAYAAILWLQVPGVPSPVTTDFVSFPGVKGTNLDLVTTADSLLKVVEAAHPNCRSEIIGARQSDAWVERIRAAYRVLGANQLDSAQFYVKQVLTLSADAPYPYEVMSQVYDQKGDRKAKVAALDTLLMKAAKGDTTFTEMRNRALWNRASTLGDLADSASNAAEKARLNKESVASYIQLVSEAPQFNLTPYALQNAGSTIALAQDSAAASLLIAPIVAAPAQYSEQALEKAGALAMETGRKTEALKLLDAAVVANPYQPQTIYNLAVIYFQEKQPAKMLPLIEKQLKLDPQNPDAVLLYTYAYQLMAEATKDLKLKKAYNDSATAFNVKSQKMTAKVGINSISRLPTKASVTGEIENLGATPASYELTIEFLDAKGEVVGSEKKSIGPVAAKKLGAWNASVEKAGVFGVRYQFAAK